MFRAIGAAARRIAEAVGGIVVMTGQVLRALVPPRIDRRELVKNLYKMVGVTTGAGQRPHHRGSLGFTLWCPRPP